MDMPVDRYHRQKLLPEIGDAGQVRLAGCSVLIVGCGALGCAQADLLVRAGVGHIRIVDRDVVEPTNLQRQTLYAEADVGNAKAIAAAARLRAINSTITIEPVTADVTSENAERLAEECDAILDGTDNFETRFLLNDVSVKLGVPYVYGGVIASRGMAATFVPGNGDHSTPCLRCVLPEPPPSGSVPTCDTAGVLGPSVAIVAAQQAADAMKVLLGRLDLLSGTMLDFDLFKSTRRRLRLVDLAGDRSACRCCGRGLFDYLDGSSGSEAVALCGRGAVQVTPSNQAVVALGGLAERLAAHGPCKRVGPLLKAETSQGNKRYGLTIFPDGRAIISGTEDPAEARSIYARLIGA
ncbi:MAG: ThiF family adenylyltransferase [Phycisphaera sp.]|nr:MAG: ThiF family adenylyltransferase [Phycisphaera sp.]